MSQSLANRKRKRRNWKNLQKAFFFLNNTNTVTEQQAINVGQVNVISFLIENINKTESSQSCSSLF